MRFLIAALQGIGRLCGAAVGSGGMFGGWLLRTAWEGMTGRSLAAEQSERQAQAMRQAEEVEAQAQAQADRDNAAARHEEAAMLAEQQLAATQSLMEELRRAERVRVAETRRLTTPVMTVRWESDDEEPEPESGAPMAPMPAMA